MKKKKKKNNNNNNNNNKAVNLMVKRNARVGLSHVYAG